MTALLKQNAGFGGSGLTWTSCGFTASDFNSRADGSVVVATSAITNGTDLDILIDVSMQADVGGTTAATSYFGLYLLPLQQDGNIYGDGVATGTTAPAVTYWKKNCYVKSGVTSGNAVHAMFEEITVPPGSYKLAILNKMGAALDSTAAAVVSYRTRTLNLNG